MSFNDKIKLFNKKVNETLTEIQRFVQTTNRFEKEWELDPLNNEGHSLQTYYDNARNETMANESKLLRESMHCVVYGSVSNGKSALINALLEKSKLPSHCGSATNSFVEIKKSTDYTNYFIFPENSERNLDINNISRIDYRDPNNIQQGSRVELYLSSKECPILGKDIVIVDTPGIDNKIEMDSKIQKECREADVLILVISCIRGLTVTEKNFLMKHKTIFSNFKILFVFNFVDSIYSDILHYKRKYTDEINAYLRDDLKIRSCSDNEIFFICAKERLEIKTNKIKDFSEDVKKRNDNFDNFQNCLQNHLTESSEKRRLNIMKENKNIIHNTFNNIKCYKTNITPRIEVKVFNILNKLQNFNKQINLEVEYIFKEMYEMIFLRGLKLIRKNFDECEELCVDTLERYLEEVMTVLTESLKNNIRRLIRMQAPEEEYYIIKILEKIYFPFYYNISNKIETSSVKELRINFIKIIEIIRKYKIITIAGAVVGGVGLVAGGGAAIGIVAPVATAIAAPTLAISGGAVGGGIGWLSSYIATKYNNFKRNAYKPRHKNQEETIKSWWSSMELLLKDSYQDFFDNLPSKITLLMQDIEEDFTRLE